MKSADYYDEYVGRQLQEGVNARHRAIVGWLRRFGLRPEHRVLEIGCGVGTVTGLITRVLGPSGHLTAADLSPKSVEAAGKRLEGVENLTLLAGNVLELELEGDFDVLVLPDVIEHIPLELHPQLFKRLASWVREDGFILLHYPSPILLAWQRDNEPHLLQHIDQPILADELTANAANAGLYLQHLETYPIWIAEGDYVAAVLRRQPTEPTFSKLEVETPPLWRRALGRLRRELGSND